MSNPSPELTGTVVKLEEPQTFASGFVKRVMILKIDEDSKFPQEIPLEFVKDNIAKIDNLLPGQKVTIGFNFRGNEYNGKYYLNLVGWKVQVHGGGQASTQPPVEEEDETEIPF